MYLQAGNQETRKHREEMTQVALFQPPLTWFFFLLKKNVYVSRLKGGTGANKGRRENPDGMTKQNKKNKRIKHRRAQAQSMQTR